MTTCSTNSCGTGLGSVLLPGDPDNNSALHAIGTFGGIDVTWTLPATNPHAVAFTRIWRGVLPDFNAAIIIAEVGGNTYYDKNTSTLDTYYYYWIQFVSINGTVFDPIGPDAALSRPPIADVIIGLSAQIDDGFLAGSLKSTIDSIGTNYTAFLNEVQGRNTAVDTLAASIDLLQTSVYETMTFVNEEIVNRQEGVSALVAELNTVAVANGENIAAVQTTLQADIAAVNGDVTAIGALYTAKVTVNGLIGGFGIYNDGTEVEAGFDVDTFWVGKTDANKKKPFIISNGQVFINQAVIGSATIDFAKINTATIGSLSTITQNVGQISMVRNPSEATFIRFGKTSVDDTTNAGFWIGVNSSGVAGVAIGGSNGLFKYSATDGLQVAGQSVSVTQPGTVVASGVLAQTYTWTNNTGLYTTFSLKLIGGGGGGGSIATDIRNYASGNAGSTTSATVKNSSGAVVSSYSAAGGAGGSGRISSVEPPQIIRRSPVIISTEDGYGGGGGWFYYWGYAAGSGAAGDYSSQTITVPLGGSVVIALGAGGSGSTAHFYNGYPGHAGAFSLTIVGA